MFPRRQNKLNLPWSSNSKSFHPPDLNACFFLLEHQRGFEPSVIVAHESLSCPQCEEMDLKIIQSLLERVQIHKDAGKPKNLWVLKDFSEEQQTVQDKQGTHEQLSQNKQTKTPAVDHPGNNTVLTIGVIFINSTYFLLWTICKHHLYVKYLIQVSTK